MFLIKFVNRFDRDLTETEKLRTHLRCYNISSRKDFFFFFFFQRAMVFNSPDIFMAPN